MTSVQYPANFFRRRAEEGTADIPRKTFQSFLTREPGIEFTILNFPFDKG